MASDGSDLRSAQESLTCEPAQVSLTCEPAQESLTCEPAQESLTCEPAQVSLTCNSSNIKSESVLLLESAAEQLMVFRNFQETFQTCDRGLHNIRNIRNQSQQEEDRAAELKASFCVLGLQALAEMNQWQKILTWVHLQYQDQNLDLDQYQNQDQNQEQNQEQIPANIMQMCIVVHWKVGAAALVEDVVRRWLLRPANRSVSGFVTVAELFLLHVLLPLGRTDAALELINGDVGGSAFTEEQRRAAMELVEETRRRREDPPPEPPPEPRADPGPGSSEGRLLLKVASVLRSLYRKLLLTCSGSSALHKLLLASLLLYLLALRLDPALPSAYVFISKLLQLLRGVWTAMFAPYYQVVTPRKRL